MQGHGKEWTCYACVGMYVCVCVCRERKEKQLGPANERVADSHADAHKWALDLGCRACLTRANGSGQANACEWIKLRDEKEEKGLWSACVRSYVVG